MMPEFVAVDQAKGEIGLEEYAPSWANRFTEWVDQLPGPSWLCYLFIGLLLFLIQIVILWGEGAYPVGTIHRGHTYIAATIPFLVALIHYADNEARVALMTLRPALEVSEKEYAMLQYRLTTLPARPTLLASLSAFTFIFLFNELVSRPGSIKALVDSQISATFLYLMYIGTWWFVGAVMYHTIHQLRAISRTYTRYTHINLFKIRPLYAFSRLTAITAVSLTFITYVYMAINPGMLSEPIAFGIALPITIVALAVFVWPLLGVHRLLVREKEQKLDEASLRIEAAINELHQRVDSGNLERMDDMNKAISSLEIEQRLLERIPTWPWQPETVRLLVTALAFPLGLWLAQYVLQHLIGR